MASNECPWKKCGKPWNEHDGIQKIVHSEKAEVQDPPKMSGRPMGCRCPILRVGDYCPIHGG